jgi:hypothetical protein
MQSVDVLDRVDRSHHVRFVDLLRQRRLDEDAVDLLVLVELAHQREQVVLGRHGRQPVVDRLDAGRLGCLVLEADVDLGGRIVTDEHCREAHVSEPGDLLAHFPAHPGRKRGAVHQLRSHAPSRCSARRR